MKAQRETLVISDATTLFEVVGKLFKNVDMFPELERVLDFLHKVVIEYRVWLAYNKEYAYPMNYHQDIKGGKKIWTIKFEEKKEVASLLTQEARKE